MPGLLIGYARCSADAQDDLTAQRDALVALGVEPERIYVDHGLTGTNRAGLDEALAACRSGDVLVVTTLDRLVRSVPAARVIVDELTAGQIKLSIGGLVYDPTDPVGRQWLNAFATLAELKTDIDREKKFLKLFNTKDDRSLEERLAPPPLPPHPPPSPEQLRYRRLVADAMAHPGEWHDGEWWHEMLRRLAARGRRLLHRRRPDARRGK
ncbi:recombinase family protein [Pseudonocardia kunmingensis]|uniref:recombinase family protein n=1 Tax=Pseudonocardia kunmingensis TaxID=630975 RepID=UPI00114E7470|nr:recombinase family protein [Pseudonocardia kunmingensis]